MLRLFPSFMRFPMLYLVIGLAVVRAAPTPVDLDDPSSPSPSMSQSSPVAETQHLVSRGKTTILLIYQDPIFGPGVDSSLHAHRTDQITGVLFSRIPGVRPLTIDAAGYPRNLDSFSGVVVGLAGCEKGCKFTVAKSRKKENVYKFQITYSDKDVYRHDQVVPQQESTTGTTHFSQDEYDRLLKRFERPGPGFVSPHQADLEYWLQHYAPPSTHYAPPITGHYPPPITHYPPPITGHYPPPSYQQYSPSYPPPPYSQHPPATYAHY
ncbi:hypothetical protein F5878DRAFT_608441 [Lentinula raphanica]|uniref:Uncharacterized protein n=1 Tax=Lentinula raphanica TaxID=153919 RepID=A0AA38UIG9_9AGAR|nr:hypothetical protein F5878DRAFT_608441 [Lentinula raphanica]